MMPMEGMPTDHLLHIVELATREFGTVFVDLPTNWTNWSLSLVAQSDLVLLITELTVASINRAKRQLVLLETQGIGDVDVRVVVNRFDKSMARTPTVALPIGRTCFSSKRMDIPCLVATMMSRVPSVRAAPSS